MAAGIATTGINRGIRHFLPSASVVAQTIVNIDRERQIIGSGPINLKYFIESRGKFNHIGLRSDEFMISAEVNNVASDANNIDINTAVDLMIDSTYGKIYS